MSKSLGNIVSLREALEKWGRETLLLYFLGGQWRKPIDFSDEALEQARAQADGFRNSFLAAPDGRAGPSWDDFSAVLEDDFNTPEALAIMHEWRSAGQHESLRRGLELFGLGSLTESTTAPPELEELAKQRADARSRGDFGEADRLRGEIESQGWEIRDVADGFQLVPK